MRHVNLLIKPASGLCNLRCKYCFYHDLAKNRQEKQSVMSRDTADVLIDKALCEAEREVTFSFQGGEPTLAGLDFFRYFVLRVKEKAERGLSVRYAIQTNGMLIDDEWAEFLAEHKFLVGLSLDGTPEMNNMHRVDASGAGTHKGIMSAVRSLERAGTDFNILTVVTANTARHARSVYTWMKKQGFRYLQFIACLDPLGQERGLHKYALTPEKYGVFLCELFDLWYDDWKRGDYVSIRLFDDYVHIAAGMGGGSCATSGECGGYLIIESDGSAYPCDFYVTDGWRLGSILNSGITELLECSRNREFIAQSAEAPQECRECTYFWICRSGCRRDRQLPEGGLGANYLCPSFKKLFGHAMPRILEMAAMEKQAVRQGVNF